MTAKQKIVALVSEDGRKVEIAAYSLSSDLWEDYQFFLNESKHFHDSNNIRSKNRSLRAGLMFLFAHFEGVTDRILNKYGIEIKRHFSLFDKLQKIRGLNIQISEENFFKIEKCFRDIIVHPGITKEDGKYDDVSVYESLSIEVLESLGGSVDSWLNHACKILGVNRFEDTSNLVNSIAQGLGEVIEEKEV